MDVRLHTDLAAFTAVAEPFYLQDPVRHTTAITALRNIEHAGRASVLVTVQDGARIRGVLAWLEPFPAVLSGIPAAAAPDVAATLRAETAPIRHVSAPRDQAWAFAESWRRHGGGDVAGSRSMNLYELGELRAPSGVPGTSRQAAEADFELLLRWRREFVDEAMLPAAADPDPEAAVRRSIREPGEWVVWEVDGQPVATAYARRPDNGMARISHVYTPRAERGHGYASAATAFVARRLREAGARHVVLFADAENPTSNRIYQRLGFRHVAGFAELTLAPV